MGRLQGAFHHERAHYVLDTYTRNMGVLLYGNIPRILCFPLYPRPHYGAWHGVRTSAGFNFLRIQLHEYAYSEQWRIRAMESCCNVRLVVIRHFRYGWHCLLYAVMDSYICYFSSSRSLYYRIRVINQIFQNTIC